MSKNLLAEVTAKATFIPEIYKVDGVQFRIGVVQNMPLFMGLSVSEVIFGDGWSGPAIIFSLDDVRKMIESKGKNYTGKFLSFVAGHEVGHMVQFKEHKTDDSFKVNQLVVNNSMEIEADCYSLEHTGSSIRDYKDFVDQIKKGSRSVYAAVQGPIVSRIASFFDDIFLDKRMKNAIKMVEGTKSISMDIVYSKIAEDVINNI